MNEDVPLRPRLGISSCLLGQEVRFDGGHKRHRFITDELANYVDLVPVCPEVEMGLGTPRETLRLVRSEHAKSRLVEPKSGADRTDAMQAWATGRLSQLSRENLDGYILKKGSPSCGLARVRLYDGREKGSHATRDATGLFAQALQERFPALPLSEEGWLNDPAMRESFLNRIFTHRRLRHGLETTGHDVMVKLHAAHKFLYMAHSPPGQTELGRIVANAGRLEPDELRSKYVAKAMQVMSVRVTRGRHANVLQHIFGFFKDRLHTAEKRDALRVISEYRSGVQPHMAPLMLLHHLLTRYDLSAWLSSQVYFEPYPRPLVA